MDQPRFPERQPNCLFLGELKKKWCPRPSALVDNTLLDLHNSSHPTSHPHSIIAKYTRHQKGFICYHYYSFRMFRCLYTVEALVSGHHPWDAKKVPVIGAGRLRECKNTEFVWDLR